MTVAQKIQELKDEFKREFGLEARIQFILSPYAGGENKNVLRDSRTARQIALALAHQLGGEVRGEESDRHTWFDVSYSGSEFNTVHCIERRH